MSLYLVPNKKGAADSSIHRCKTLEPEESGSFKLPQGGILNTGALEDIGLYWDSGLQEVPTKDSEGQLVNSTANEELLFLLLQPRIAKFLNLEQSFIEPGP